MWAVDGMPKDPTRFGRFEPKDVLVWYDGPRTFTVDDAGGGLCLAHWLDEDAEAMRFAVAPISPKHLEQLLTGELTLREGLDQPNVYVVDVSGDWVVRSVWSSRLAVLPADALPAVGAVVRRGLESVSTGTARRVAFGQEPGDLKTPGS